MTPVGEGHERLAAGLQRAAATNDQQIVLAAEVMVSSPDFGHLEPMFAATGRELKAAGVSEVPEVLLADAGYRHHEQMQRIMATGTDVVIPPDSSRRRGKSTRAGWDGGLYALMRRALSTDRGRELYGKRQPMIKPVFANTKFNRKITRFIADAEPPSGPSGACSRPPTTSSSSTTTISPPQASKRRPPARPDRCSAVK